LDLRPHDSCPPCNLETEMSSLDMLIFAFDSLTALACRCCVVLTRTAYSLYLCGRAVEISSSKMAIDTSVVSASDSAGFPLTLCTIQIYLLS